MFNILKKLQIISCIAIILFGFNFVSALTLEFEPLVPNALPGLTTNASTVDNLGNFLGSLFKFGIALAVALAVIMCIWGGIEYMTTDSWQKKSDGERKIKDSLSGLALALSSYFILYIINPNLVDFTNNKLVNGLGNLSTTTPVAGPALAVPPAPIGSQEWSQQHPCNDCVDVFSKGMICKEAPCKANDLFLQHVKIAYDNAIAKGIFIRITEGWPITAAHTVGGCHDHGNCVDINLDNRSIDGRDGPVYAADPVNVRKLYESLTTTYGASLHVLFESFHCPDYPFITNCLVTANTNGQHFHISLDPSGD